MSTTQFTTEMEKILQTTGPQTRSVWLMQRALAEMVGAGPQGATISGSGG